MPKPPPFKIRFHPQEIPAIAARYSFGSSDTPSGAGERAFNSGHYSREDFLDVCQWKSGRTRRLCASNPDALVREVTTIALATHEERLRIGVLTLLRGVSWPTASVLLHFAMPERYPILDFRALWSLSINNPPKSYTFEFWNAYVAETRRIASASNVTMRDLDRALWQFSKEMQGAIGDGKD